MRGLLTLILSLGLGCAACAPALPPARAAALDKLDPEHLLAVAETAARLGDRLRAQQYLLAAWKTGATPGRVLPPLLSLYLADGQYRLAIDTLQEHLRRNPHAHGLRLLLGDLYAATQLEAAAIAEYERVLSALPDDPRPHFALATLLHDRGREPLRADAHFRAYLAKAPEGEHADEARSLLLEVMP